MSNQLVKQESTPVAQPIVGSETAQVMAVIERVASNPDADIDKLERLLDMQEWVMNRNAEQAFNAALAQMQSELPTVAETAKGHNSNYAPLEKINETVRPTLQKHGFAVTFRTDQGNNGVKITAVLSHRDGHHQETSLILPLDTSGSKNAVQAIGSTVSYGRRYALCALLNISTGDDTDGEPPKAGNSISPDQIQKIRNAIKMAGDDEQMFCKSAGISSIHQLEAARFPRAMNYLKNKAQGAVQ
ncbi:ERF family protein [Microbulbifer sp. 2205BS26-8]|uniref:ERF family protein n=1 Tax=Microbulbifer sp. 2205BS26-8 TaxID=3064386 RepID=UPI00273F303C|nr:ERF family protein [Microbulbifer sp. 2205BS26-8]MDP5211322.1 ERF family protein [Microbulbifer sp. 2205BS26-8]